MLKHNFGKKNENLVRAHGTNAFFLISQSLFSRIKQASPWDGT